MIGQRPEARGQVAREKEEEKAGERKREREREREEESERSTLGVSKGIPKRPH